MHKNFNNFEFLFLFTRLEFYFSVVLFISNPPEDIN